MNPLLATLAEKAGCLLVERNMRCAVAESCTGGGLAFAMTSVSGSSQWFERGFVTYSNLAKQELLHVPEALIKHYGAVSEETVKAMAVGALEHSAADIAVAITGIAGPLGGSVEKPVGTVWFGIASCHSSPITLHQCFSGNREEIRLEAIQEALAFLCRVIVT